MALSFLYYTDEFGKDFDMKTDEKYYPEEKLIDERMEIFPDKNRQMAKRRKNDENKARRKEKLASAIYPYGWNAPHGYFRKGKIHCSCPICSAKTNSSLNKSKGPVCSLRYLCRLSLTNERYGKKHYKPSDKKKIDSLNNQLYDYYLQ